jgi:hypothetical protein
MLGERGDAMRKQLMDAGAKTAELGGTAANNWINLEAVAAVEISSEEQRCPIERALGLGADREVSTGWRAATTGPQTIRLRFDRPTEIRRIYLHFVEGAKERSQEFSVHAGSAESELREVVRQQFAFSPNGATEEVEDYRVDLKNVRVFELRVDPDRAHDPKQSREYASLVRLKVA